jgi:hypothetical protein
VTSRKSADGKATTRRYSDKEKAKAVAVLGTGRVVIFDAHL